FSHARAATASASSSGHPGYKLRMSSANCLTYRASARSRVTAARPRATRRRPSSEIHSLWARSSAAASTRRPCRSYCPRERLKRRTTALRLEYLRLRRVSAVSPAGSHTRWSRWAHFRQSGRSASILRKLPGSRSTPHWEHAEGFRIEKTTTSRFLTAIEFPAALADDTRTGEPLVNAATSRRTARERRSEKSVALPIAQDARPSVVSLLCVRIFDTRGDSPNVPRGVHDPSGAVTPELVLRRNYDLGAASDRALDGPIDVFDVDEDHYRRASI